MDRKEAAGCESAAQKFCADNYEWLVVTSERVLTKRGFSGRGRDLAHDVRNRCERVPDEIWVRVEKKEAYVARIIINEANNFCREHSHLVELSSVVLSSSAIEAMEDGILIEEVCSKLSPDENHLVELIYEGYSELEMSEQLGIAYGALRKRVERLKKKLRSIVRGEEAIPRPEQLSRKLFARRD